MGTYILWHYFISHLGTSDCWIINLKLGTYQFLLKKVCPMGRLFLLLIVYSVFKSFTCRNFNFCTGLRIFTCSCSSLTNFKVTESYKRNPITFSHCFCDWIKCSFSNSFRILFWSTCLCNNCFALFTFLHHYPYILLYINLLHISNSVLYIKILLFIYLF